MSTLHAANIYQDKEGVNADFILLTPTCGFHFSLFFSAPGPSFWKGRLRYPPCNSLAGGYRSMFC